MSTTTHFVQHSTLAQRASNVESSDHTLKLLTVLQLASVASAAKLARSTRKLYRNQPGVSPQPCLWHLLACIGEETSSSSSISRDYEKGRGQLFSFQKRDVPFRAMSGFMFRKVLRTARKPLAGSGSQAAAAIRKHELLRHRFSTHRARTGVACQIRHREKVGAASDHTCFEASCKTLTSPAHDIAQRRPIWFQRPFGLQEKNAHPSRSPELKVPEFSLSASNASMSGDRVLQPLLPGRRSGGLAE